MSLNNIEYKLNNKILFKIDNLDIFSNDKILILGSNGIGKTTFFNILSNQIKISNKKYKQFLTKFKRNIFFKLGYVYQNPNYQLFMTTVEQEIKVSAKSNEYANFIIKKLDLYNLLDKHPHSLSEGEKRLVGIASILAMKPSVLLLDEPTVGLSANKINLFLNLITEISSMQEITIITSSHDIRVFDFFSERVLFFDGDKNIRFAKDLYSVCPYLQKLKDISK